MPQAQAASSAPRPIAPQAVEVVIWVPGDHRSSSITGTTLGANANMGRRVEARCTRWGRNLDGSIRLGLEVTVTSPAGTLPALGSPGRGEP